MQRGPRTALEASPPARCDTLAVRVLALDLVGIIAGPVSAGASTAAAVFQGDTRYWFMGTALVVSLTGTITGHLATFEAAAMKRECP